jgi:hypothetical protein
LPGASALAPLLCDNTWQVAVPMTSNPKAVHNGQYSSSIPLHYGTKILSKSQDSEIAA